MNGSQTDAIVGALRTLHLRKMKARADGPYVAARRAMNAYEALLARFSRGLDALLPPQELDDPLSADLLAMQRAVLRHPVAAGALYRGLVAEGRSFAETEDGARWADQLRRSVLLRRVRVAWLSVSGNLLSEQSEALLPGQLIEVLASTAQVDDVHALFSNLVFGAEATP